MALIRRVSRLFAADMHAVLDRIEEPQALLKQSIREMEQELARQREHREWLGREVERAATEIEQLDSLEAGLGSQLDLCFAEHNEALARRLVRRRLETEKLSRGLSAKRNELAAQLADIESVIAENQDVLEGMRQKAKLFAVSSVGADVPGGRTSSEISDDEVEIAFLREKQARQAS